MSGELHFSTIVTNGLRLNVAQAGPSSGKLAILLHGFPEFWYGWRKQIPELAAAGFRIWAPDQRGYAASEKPLLVCEYTLDKLAADVAGLIAASGQQRAAVIGHDWGGAVAWWLAVNKPELVERLVILNVPHPIVMRRMILTNPRQTLRSWYMFAIQIPWLVEWSVRRNNWQPMVNGLKASSRAGTFTEADFEMYRQAWSQPGALTAALNWYRAMFRYGVSPAKYDRVLPTTLILWGKQDRFVLPEAANASLAQCDNGRLVTYENATHWLQHEESDDVNRHIVEFLGQ
jgi:pimeloyl-ACP methyl ester carboxylesterase